MNLSTIFPFLATKAERQEKRFLSQAISEGKRLQDWSPSSGRELRALALFKKSLVDNNISYYPTFTRKPIVEAMLWFSNKEKENFTEKEFCQLYTNYYGEQVDNIKQMRKDNFIDKELFEFVKFLIENR